MSIETGDVIIMVIGSVLSFLTYRVSNQLGELTTALRRVVREVDDHETRIRAVEHGFKGDPGERGPKGDRGDRGGWA